MFSEPSLGSPSLLHDAQRKKPGTKICSPPSGEVACLSPPPPHTHTHAAFLSEFLISLSTTEHTVTDSVAKINLQQRTLGLGPRPLYNHEWFKKIKIKQLLIVHAQYEQLNARALLVGSGSVTFKIELSVYIYIPNLID